MPQFENLWKKCVLSLKYKAKAQRTTWSGGNYQILLFWACSFHFWITEVQSEKNYSISRSRIIKADWIWCILHPPEGWEGGIQGLAATGRERSCGSWRSCPVVILGRDSQSWICQPDAQRWQGLAKKPARQQLFRSLGIRPEQPPIGAICSIFASISTSHSSSKCTLITRGEVKGTTQCSFSRYSHFYL